MTGLRTETGFTDVDGFYEQLIDLHRDLSMEESHALNARLVLLLANHIGDNEVLAEAMRYARGTGNPSSEG